MATDPEKPPDPPAEPVEPEPDNESPFEMHELDRLQEGESEDWPSPELDP